MTSHHPKKDALLRMPLGTAFGRLRKSVMFNLLCKLGENVCFRCGLEIETVQTMTIEHKESWMSASDPAQSFFSMENIAFSHHACNCSAAMRVNKIYPDKKARDRARALRCVGKRVAANKIRRQKLRDAGLPYT
jgi:hypothetical protein